MKRKALVSVFVPIVIAMLLRTGLAEALSAQTCGMWHIVSSPNPGQGYWQFNGVAAVSDDDVWTVGGGAGGYGPTLIENWNGKKWSIVSSPKVDGQLNGIVAVSANDIWVAGTYDNGRSHYYQTLIEHWDGKQWSIIPSPNPTQQANNSLLSIAAISADDIWAVGNSGARTLTERWNGKKWSIIPSPNNSSTLNLLSGAVAISTNDVWAVGYSWKTTMQTLIERWDGKKWSIVSSPNTRTCDFLNGAVTISKSDIWAVGNATSDCSKPRYTDSDPLFEHWDGKQWHIISGPQPPGVNFLYAVAAVSSSDIWAVGYTHFDEEPLTAHWDGSSWSIVPNSNYGVLYGVAATPAGGFWAVGYGSHEKTLTEFYC